MSDNEDLNAGKKKQIQKRVLTASSNYSKNFGHESAFSTTNTETGSALTKIETNDIEVQTEWSWIEDLKLLEKLRSFNYEFLLEDEVEEKKEEPDFSDESLVIEEVNESMAATETPGLDIGPPKILQYISETRKRDLSPPEIEPIPKDENIDTMMKGFNVNIRGNAPCEFCGSHTLPWPTIDDQEKKFPEELYCCTDYREYVEALIQIQKAKDESADKLINVAPHPKTRNKKEKALAKQRAELKAKEKNAAKERKKKEEEKEKEQERVPSRSTDRPTENTFVDRSHSDFEHFKSRHSSVTNTTSNQKKARDSKVSRQIRTINYQLSNLQCLNDGWTVRQPSPLEFEDISDSDDDADVLVPAFIPSAELKMKEKPLFMRNYKNGNLCMILFPDNTGNIYYENGRLAMTISLIARGMHVFTLLTDHYIQDIIAIFDPFGNVCCNFPSGKLRIQMGPFGGAEFEHDEINGVHRRKRWLWWDGGKHVHAPPFQPISFNINTQFGIKIHNQQKIYLTFTADGHQYNFRVGSKLQVAKPETIPNGFKVDTNMQILNKTKTKIEKLLKTMNKYITKTNVETKLSNTLKLPKILSEAENMFSDKPTVRSTTSRSLYAKSTSSKLLSLEPTTRTKMLTSRTLNDKVITKSDSKFLLVP